MERFYMKVSELTIPVIANYCRIMDDDVTDSENLSLEAMKIAALSYARSYTGLSDLEMERHEDITIAILTLIADMYDNRSMIVDKNNVNRTAEVILSMHAKNLLPGGASDGN
nr:MAG TPA: head tail connector [Siphoviridae sp. ctBho3]